jgi:hypothetical protein
LLNITLTALSETKAKSVLPSPLKSPTIGIQSALGGELKLQVFG